MTEQQPDQPEPDDTRREPPDPEGGEQNRDYPNGHEVTDKGVDNGRANG